MRRMCDSRTSKLAANDGHLRAEILVAEGKVIAPFTSRCLVQCTKRLFALLTFV